MSYLEIYNENIRDLLDPSTGYLELRDESRGRNIQVPYSFQNGDFSCSVGVKYYFVMAKIFLPRNLAEFGGYTRPPPFTESSPLSPLKNFTHNTSAKNVVVASNKNKNGPKRAKKKAFLDQNIHVFGSKRGKTEGILPPTLPFATNIFGKNIWRISWYSFPPSLRKKPAK